LTGTPWRSRKLPELTADNLGDPAQVAAVQPGRVGGDAEADVDAPRAAVRRAVAAEAAQRLLSALGYAE
jgi:hypothetical protein